MREGLASIFATAVLVGGGLAAAVGLSVTHSERITVNDKAATGGSDGKYLIYTDARVYSDEDSLLNLKFNSSDLYAALKPGCTYDVDVNGVRFQILSAYENIITAKHVPTEKCPVAPPMPH